MKKKIEKIRIIDAPKENTLEGNELLNFLGGDNCATYDVSTCFDNKKITCTIYDTEFCAGIDVNGVKCGKFITDSGIFHS